MKVNAEKCFRTVGDTYIYKCHIQTLHIQSNTNIYIHIGTYTKHMLKAIKSLSFFFILKLTYIIYKILIDFIHLVDNHHFFSFFFFHFIYLLIYFFSLFSC